METKLTYMYQLETVQDNIECGVRACHTDLKLQRDSKKTMKQASESRFLEEPGKGPGLEGLKRGKLRCLLGRSGSEVSKEDKKYAFDMGSKKSLDF